MLLDIYVKDLCDVVKVGDIVKVKVLEVDVVCKWIVLICCLDDILVLVKVLGECDVCLVGGGCCDGGGLCFGSWGGLFGLCLGSGVLLVNNVLVDVFVCVKCGG